MKATGPDTQLVERTLASQVQQLRRERSLLLAALVLVVALGLLGRTATRVWAIAVHDGHRDAFVEQVYLPQAVQAEAVQAALIERARLAHPFYKDAKELFYGEAHPGFQEPMVVRRVRRSIPASVLADDARPGTPQPPTYEPVEAAVRALADDVTVTASGWAIYDVEKHRPLAVLPTQAMAEEARQARLENVSRRVEAQLKQLNQRALKLPGASADKPANYLVSVDFLQPTDIRIVPRHPVADIRTVKQAVDYLTHGDTTATTHVVQAGETANQIAAKYDVRREDLERWNSSRDLSLPLQVGEKLFVRRPEPPLTVVTIERRSYIDRGARNGKPTKELVTVEMRRHDGDEPPVSRVEVDREPLS